MSPHDILNVNFRDHSIKCWISAHLDHMTPDRTLDWGREIVPLFFYLRYTLVYLIFLQKHTMSGLKKMTEREGGSFCGSFNQQRKRSENHCRRRQRPISFFPAYIRPSCACVASHPSSGRLGPSLFLSLDDRAIAFRRECKWPPSFTMGPRGYFLKQYPTS